MKTKKKESAGEDLSPFRGIQIIRLYYGLPLSRFIEPESSDLLRFSNQSRLANPVHLIFYVYHPTIFSEPRSSYLLCNTISHFSEIVPSDVLCLPINHF